MNSHQRWFMIRLFAGLVMCAIFSGAYLIFTSWRAERTDAIAIQTARERLAECASLAGHETDIQTLLAQCGTAAAVAREAASTVHGTDRRSERLAASSIIFIRFGARFFDARKYSTESEQLAAFSLDVEPITAWWASASVRLLALSGYDPAADMFQRSATENPRDFIRRLYMTKSALLLVKESMVRPEAQKLGASVAGISDAISDIDRLIIATDHQDITGSNALRQQYLSRLSELRAQASRAYGNAVKNLQEGQWPLSAADLLSRL